MHFIMIEFIIISIVCKAFDNYIMNNKKNKKTDRASKESFAENTISFPSNLEQDRSKLIELYNSKYKFIVHAVEESIKCSNLSSDKENIAYKIETT